MVRDHAALVAFLEARMRAPFAWGANDDVTFAAEAARLVAGRDLRKRLGCRWSTEGGADRALAARGGRAAALDALLPRIAPAMAQRGDLGLARLGAREVLVVVEIDLLATPGPQGLVRLPRRALLAAWSLDAHS